MVSEQVGQVGMSLRENNHVLLMFDSRTIESNVTTSVMPVVYNILMFLLKIFVSCLKSVNLSLMKVKS